MCVIIYTHSLSVYLPVSLSLSPLLSLCASLKLSLAFSPTFSLSFFFLFLSGYLIGPLKKIKLGFCMCKAFSNNEFLQNKIRQHISHIYIYIPCIPYLNILNQRIGSEGVPLFVIITCSLMLFQDISNYFMLSHVISGYHMLSHVICWMIKSLPEIIYFWLLDEV